jgi:asparagine synthase (glutamine-hydrolysing)
MFAIALYDGETHRLSLARDRLGIKPLYVCERDGAFFFASEVKALRSWLELDVCAPRLLSFLMGQEPPVAGETFFRDVAFLAPGAVLTASPEGRRLEPSLSRADLWDPDLAETLAGQGDERLIDTLDAVFHRSVASQLVADTPVAALLSGGVDSSLLVSVAARSHGDLALFHADVVGRESEHPAALRLARHLGLELQKIEVRDEDFLLRLPDVVAHWEHPQLVQPNAVAFLKVSELVRSHGIKAVLSGEGSDEAFLGYWWMMPDLVSTVRRNLRDPFSVPRKLARRLHGAAPVPVPDVADWSRALGRALAGSEPDAEQGAVLEEIERRHGARPEPREAMSLAWLGTHLRHLLVRNDTLGMAASIESRFPFLDTDVLKLAVNLPYARRVRRSPAGLDLRHLFLVDKWPVRALARRYVPRSVARRPKRGFVTSAQDRMRIPWQLLDGTWLADLLGLRAPELERLFAAAPQGLKLHLMQAYVWGEVCVHGVATTEMEKTLSAHVALAPGA